MDCRFPSITPLARPIIVSTLFSLSLSFPLGFGQHFASGQHPRPFQKKENWGLFFSLFFFPTPRLQAH